MRGRQAAQRRSSAVPRTREMRKFFCQLKSSYRASSDCAALYNSRVPTELQREKTKNSCTHRHQLVTEDDSASSQNFRSFKEYQLQLVGYSLCSPGVLCMRVRARTARSRIQTYCSRIARQARGMHSVVKMPRTLRRRKKDFFSFASLLLAPRARPKYQPRLDIFLGGKRHARESKLKFLIPWGPSSSSNSSSSVHGGCKDFGCDKCEEKFGNKSHLLFHLKTVNEGRKDLAFKVFKNYLCDNCGKKLRNKRNLLYHITTVHEGRKDYACNKCEKKFGKKQNLLDHQKSVHEGRKDYSCHKCEKKFGNRNYFYKHQKIVHESCKDFACDKCDKKFGYKSHLLVHQKTIHQGRKDFVCDKCEKKFTQNPHLLAHVKIVHEGRKDYACDKCEKKFGLKQQLVVHQRTVHKGRKDYACDKCEKKFGKKHNLLAHLKIVHEGRKDYACNQCEKKFGKKSDLLKHQRTVHEDGKKMQEKS
ncbi:unnamed protein product [Trichogramma brassicae]|uniref:C2H2-type domain-containing protein n=1 Tax=Trichogramma brassicae TaxID=86971 RepID=A0A6H5IVA5_9HYME|nr:unnamed protein product [Trichogramma brassicae]